MSRIIAGPVFGLLILVGGCAAAPAVPEASYHTTARDPRRNTELARQLNLHAVNLLAGGNWDKAETALKSALDADITFGPAHNNLGRVEYHKSDFYQAAWEFQYAIKLMPDQPEPRNNLGLVWESAGKLDDAIKSYDEAMALDANNIECMGNDARARVRRGDRDTKLSDLLSKLVLRDTRPDWSSWAREQLILLSRSASPTPAN